MEGTIGKLFEGRIHNFVECINVDYKSTRQEVFADLQLLVKGCKNMYESFDKYVEVENLEGQNQYMAEGHGLQVRCPWPHVDISGFHDWTPVAHMAVCSCAKEMCSVTMMWLVTERPRCLAGRQKGHAL